MTALRSFLTSVLPAGIEVFRGQQNRVPEPTADNFVVFWPLRQERLGTNEVTTIDNIVIGSITGTALTVSEVLQGQGPLLPGRLLSSGTRAPGVAAATVLVSGTAGGIGVYIISPTQTLASGILYVGERDDLESVEWVVQADIHGSASGDNVRVIEQLFRSEVAVDIFDDVGYSVVPLFSSEARQAPFWNQEQQVEYRWTIDLHMMLSPIVSTPQQFADELHVDTVEVDATFPP